MNVEDIEFLAENSLIDIVPNFTCSIIHFIGGDVGPMKSGISCKVPLWFAVNLKQQQKCNILTPFWLTVESLQDIIHTEKQLKNFGKMPSEHYMIEAKILLNVASDDIPDSFEVKTLVKDLWDIRQSKLRTSVDALIREGVMAATVNNLTMLEIDSIRPLLPDSMAQILRMRNQERSGTQSQNYSTLSLK